MTRAPRASHWPARPASTSPWSVPVQPVGAGQPARGHPVLVAGLGRAGGSRATSRQPSSPTVIDRVLDGGARRRRVQHDGARPAGRSSTVSAVRLSTHQCLESGRRAGEVEPPAAARAAAPAPGARRTRRRTPPGDTSVTGSKVDAVGGAGDDDRDPAALGQRAAYAVGQPEDAVDQHGARGARPVAGPGARVRARRPGRRRRWAGRGDERSCRHDSRPDRSSL